MHSHRMPRPPRGLASRLFTFAHLKAPVLRRAALATCNCPRCNENSRTHCQRTATVAEPLGQTDYYVPNEQPFLAQNLRTQCRAHYTLFLQHCSPEGPTVTRSKHRRGSTPGAETHHSCTRPSTQPPSRSALYQLPKGGHEGPNRPSGDFSANATQLPRLVTARAPGRGLRRSSFARLLRQRPRR